ncbi:DNA repair ATPase [Deltaproteobacteria bacterium OttesenSCG-928-M10]|nr:DNA repair ATPase [Deltaproteobacteria bacterium OttesenSCG-928-M10]
MSEVFEEVSQERQAVLEAAVAEGGAYEILRRRLQELGGQLQAAAKGLNERRLAEFGKSDMDIVSRLRIRTENNCQARDIVQVGGFLLFGYNVFIGLKKETRIEDVFSLYRLEESGDGYEAAPVPLQGTFLADPAFVRDFTELYTYYKDTAIVQLSVWDGKLLASFKIGLKVSDVRVFRWSVAPDGRTITYIDNRGERDIKLPPAHDFEWVRTGRENAVGGRHPHINILDTVFVETVGGDLTVKMENNTEDGLGIYREDVLDKTQSLDDGQIEYAKVGSLILLKILPYRETVWRYLVYNILTHDVRRIDAIGQASLSLPEDHGLIFPGGYYLQSGECKTFDQSMEGMLFRRQRKSPNGEDVLYVFYDPEKSRLALFKYNMIDRELGAPILGNGYTLIEDGRMIIFEDQGDEATRVHPMQIWQTPFYTDEYASRKKTGNSVLARVGNADLVRGISDLYNVVRAIEAPKVSSALYGKLSQDTRRLFDAYFWMKDEANFQVAGLLKEIAKTGELVIDEYEKVESIRRQSDQALKEAAGRQKELFTTLVPDAWENIRDYADALERIQLQRGRLISLKDLRYLDLTQVEDMEAELKEREDGVARAAAAFLADERSLAPYGAALKTLGESMARAAISAALNEPEAELAKIGGDLDTLSALMSAITFEDATLQTRIIENISEVYARVNQARARLAGRRRELGGAEDVARFAARFKLFSQAIASSLSLAADPERCDEELARLLLQLEELESQFGEYDEFLNDILQKREELLETFESHKQTLVDARQRRTRSLADSAVRILETLPRRAARFTANEEVYGFFAADPMVRKVRELAAQLREQKDSVRADDVEARLAAARDQALRGLRDKADLFEDGGAVIRLGPRHRFSVNTQELDLTILPHEDGLQLSLTGTDFQEPVADHELAGSREYWNMLLESESPAVSRAEFLAYQILQSARRGEGGLGYEQLTSLLAQPEEMESLVRAYAAPLYRDGYEKGIHDHDAFLILQKILPLIDGADLLRYSPDSRALAMLFWQRARHEEIPSTWVESARTSQGVRQLYRHDAGLKAIQGEMEKAMAAFLEGSQLDLSPDLIAQAAEFLSLTLARQPEEFLCGKYARSLYQELRLKLEENHLWAGYADMQRGHGDRLAWRWRLMTEWLRGLASQAGHEALAPYVAEAAALAVAENSGEINVRFSEADLNVTVEGLLSTHPRIAEGRLALSVDDFFCRLRHHQRQVAPGFRHYQQVRHEFLEKEKKRLRLEEFKPKPLTSFVRNRLIDEVYLPIIGDNLAKQMGAAGSARRTDLMGLLMLISPPGYGKTTLMEYVAHCLGLIFMKINGPSLGHSVISLDPARAPDGTSRQELIKLNLALEMGNNVMLYIDDIQHTNPEFLQKFISLCDATRRIEGVWGGHTRTYDLRGKKFCVVMAGNPYTESGEVFKIPDMLANRADVYNLGEVLGGLADAFALSYVENSLTSNPVLAPLSQRDLGDLYQFLDRAQGKPVSAGGLAHNYSEAEQAEIVAVLSRLLTLRETVMKVNAHYISSAAQSDKYRTEPPFKLQGSYRNMNKLAQQVSAVMNDRELDRLLDDMYIGEAQLLTGYAEENLLKLAEIRGNLTPAQSERWDEIKRQFNRDKTFGGDEAGAGDRLVAQLADLVHYVKNLGQDRGGLEKLTGQLGALAGEVRALKTGPSASQGIEFQVAKLVEAVGELAQNRRVVKISDLMETVGDPRKAPVTTGPSPVQEAVLVPSANPDIQDMVNIKTVKSKPAPPAGPTARHPARPVQQRLVQNGGPAGPPPQPKSGQGPKNNPPAPRKPGGGQDKP